MTPSVMLMMLAALFIIVAAVLIYYALRSKGDVRAELSPWFYCLQVGSQRSVGAAPATVKPTTSTT